MSDKKTLAAAGAAVAAGIVIYYFLTRKPEEEKVAEKPQPQTIDQWAETIAAEFEKTEQPVMEDGYPDQASYTRIMKLKMKFVSEIELRMAHHESADAVELLNSGEYEKWLAIVLKEYEGMLAKKEKLGGIIADWMGKPAEYERGLAQVLIMKYPEIQMVIKEQIEASTKVDLEEFMVTADEKDPGYEKVKEIYFKNQEKLIDHLGGLTALKIGIPPSSKGRLLNFIIDHTIKGLSGFRAKEFEYYTIKHGIKGQLQSPHEQGLQTAMMMYMN